MQGYGSDQKQYEREAEGKEKIEVDIDKVLEAKAMVGKGQDEINFRKVLKEKLKVTKIPKLKLEDKDSGELYSFN